MSDIIVDGYTDASQATIRATIDGVVRFVPADRGLGGPYQQAIADWEAEGNVIPDFVPNPPSLADFEDAIQGHVDATARERTFRDGVTLASYVASTNPQWAAEAQAFVAWRDAVWAYAYAELAKVQGGLREQPTVEDFLTELPAIAWPAA